MTRISTAPPTAWCSLGNRPTWSQIQPGRVKVFHVLLLSACALMLASGCEKPTGSVESSPSFISLHGSVQGGQHPISGSSLQLYAAGSGGVGSAALPLLSQPARSDSSGGFSFSAACPSPTSQLYLTATEGNPGLLPGTNNPTIALMAALGPCSERSPSRAITVNEATTVGSIWPLASYMSSASVLGYSPGDASFSTAITLVGQLVDISQGVSPGAGIPEGYLVQSAKLDSLADILDACINSYGGTAGDGSPCGTLFSLGTPRGGSPPTDTLKAALVIAQTSSDNVTNIFGIVPRGGAFQPTLSVSPTDWSLPLLPVPSAPTIEPSPGPYAAGQQITLTDSIPNAVIHYTTDGSSPSAGSSIYGSPFTLASSETVRAIAVEEGISSASSSASYTVNEAHLAFITQPANTLARSVLSPAPAVSVVDSNGNRLVNAANLITLSPSPGMVLNGPTTVTAVQGIATFANLSITTAGTGFTLAASSPGVGSSTSAAFNVTSPGISFSLPTSSLNVGSTLGGSVALGAPAGAGGVNITLVSSAANDVGISPSVLAIAAGQSAGPFTLSGVAAGSSTITATAAGYSAASAQVAAVAAPMNAALPGISFVLPSSSVIVGSTASGSISLGAPAGTGGVTVTLVSSSANDAGIAPGAVSIAAGQSSGAFTLSGLAAGSSTLTATAAGYGPGSTLVTVTAASTPAPPAPPVPPGPTVTTIEPLGAITAAQAVNGLGFNVSPGNAWEFQMAAAAGATHARYQCGWYSTENQNPPPNNTVASPQYTLQSDCDSGLAAAASARIHSTILAAYGPPFHQILTITVPNGAPAGATSLDVQFMDGVGGDTLSSMAPFYDTIISTSKAQITNKHSYAGGLIIGVSLSDSAHATLTLASGLTSALPANTRYVINEYLYPPPATFSPTDPSVLAFARYAEFLAGKISATGVSGEVEIWNEPPWSDDPWDDRYDFYDHQPLPVSPGPQTTYLPNWGFAAALQAQAAPVAGVTYNWGGTNKSGFNSMMNPQMLANTGASFRQPNAIVTTESFHPYGNNPEDGLWSEPCLTATIKPYPAAASSYSACNFFPGPNAAYAVQQSLVQKSINPSWGIGHNITETGFSGAAGDDLHKARFVVRQFLGYQAAGVTPVQFYRLYDNSADNFSFVNPTANADGTHSPLPAYTALAGLMADIATIKLAPVAALAATNLPAIASYSGTYPLDTLSIAGSRAGDKVNSVLFTVWQRSNTSGKWATLASPAVAPVTVQLPAGVSVVAVVNLDTRASVPYTTAAQQITFAVSDDPVEVLVEPAN